MITKEKALENVKEYLKERKRNFKNINENLDEIFFDIAREIPYPYSKYYEQKRDIYTIAYYCEGYYEDESLFVIVDAETGEVLFTMTEHGYVEDWEE
ncbi:hypothetical protein [Chryseobacterium lineare]